MAEEITVVYTGGQGELITANGVVITRDKPVALPKALAEFLLKERPEEFKLASTSESKE